MATPINPKTRPLIALTDSGEQLVVTQFTSSEGIDMLFEHKAVIVVQSLDQQSMLGKSVSFIYQPGIGQERKKERFFHGFCSSIKLIGGQNDREYLYYELCVVPWSWFLTLTNNCRVYQKKKAGEIISLLAGEHGFRSSLAVNISSDQQRDYCVQFNESDWDFIQRLIQSQGWFFYFTQEEGGHKLVVVDSNQRFKPCAVKDIHYFADSQCQLSETITRWEHLYRAQPGVVVSSDYNYEYAQPVFSDEAKTQYPHAQSKHIEQFIYPGGFDEASSGTELSSQRIKGMDAGVSEVNGSSGLYHFASGTTFALAHHPVKSEQQTWLLREVVHEIMTPEDGHSIEYQNQFVCGPADTPWQSRQLIPKPLVSGVQSALVTGPNNEEICQDKYHRIKLKFHWDRQGKDDQTSSCWVRVAQLMAGDGFGGQFTPRVGDEVLVSFLDGDPDRPLVVGAVYNGKHQQPYTGGMEQGVKLKSLPDAGTDNFSEVRFNCKKGQELLFFQAEKDMSVVVKNDSERKVTGKDITSVDKSSERTIKENDSHKIQGELVTEVSKTISTKTEADYQLQAKDKIYQQTDSDYSLTTKGKVSIDSKEEIMLDAKSNMSLKASLEQALEANSISAKGAQTIKLVVGGANVSLSQSSAEISCGASSIKLSPGGIEISGLKVTMEGQTSAQVKGNVSASLEGGVNTEVKGTLVTVNGNAMTTVKAGAMLELSGAIAKIN